MVEFRPAGLGVWFGLVLGPSFLSPPSVCSSLPSTMTWAPCPHGVRTRGKKTCATDSARWMGKHKHCYWHWLQCQLPTGKVSLTTLKLTHPDVIPRRDRIAAPMRLASWIRFETAMTSDDWEGAISLLVSNLHRPDQELLVLLQSCVAGANCLHGRSTGAAAQKLPCWQR